MELDVQKYLRSGRSPEDLKNDYGIGFRHHSKYHLISFKYDQIDSHHHRAEKIVRECRGLILESALKTWKVVAYPFERFFNLGDGFADDIDWDSAVVQEKLDGSLMILYFYQNEWHVASSGTPDAGGNVGLTDKTFKELFWVTFGNQVGWKWLTRALHRLPTDITFMFELCALENRVVVLHKEPKVVLLGARNRVTGQEYRPGEMIHLFSNTSIPAVYPVGSPKEANEYLEKMRGSEQEGFVVVDKHFNRIKMKCGDYVTLHHLTDNLLSMRLIVDNIIKKNETLEVAATFPQYEELLFEADKKYHNFINELEEDYEAIKDIEDQKEFALKAKDSRCSEALFSLRAGKVTSIGKYVREMHIDSLLKQLGYK